MANNNYPYAAVKNNGAGKAFIKSNGIPKGGVSKDRKIMLVDNKGGEIPNLPFDLIPYKPPFASGYFNNWPYITHDEAKTFKGLESNVGLQQAKDGKLREIRDKDEDVLSHTTFTFDEKQFGLSRDHRILWIGVVLGQDKIPPQAWPMGMTTIEGEQYTLTKANADNFWVSAMLVVQGVLNSSAPIKNQVYLAQTVRDVWSVEDPR